MKLNDFTRPGVAVLALAVGTIAAASVGSQPSKGGFYVETPYVRQVSNYCGPAVIAMVFRYWKTSADQHEMAAGFQPFPRKGLSGKQLKELATARGFSGLSFAGTPDFVRQQLRKGRPLVVALAPSGLSTFNHYVVLVGWDEASREWIFHDPSLGPYRRESAADFESRWGKLGRWSLLVVPMASEETQ